MYALPALSSLQRNRYIKFSALAFRTNRHPISANLIVCGHHTFSLFRGVEATAVILHSEGDAVGFLL